MYYMRKLSADLQWDTRLPHLSSLCSSTDTATDAGASASFQVYERYAALTETGA